MELKRVIKVLLEMKTMLLSIIFPVVLWPILFTVEGDVGRCVYAISLMVAFWIFEVFPFAVTSLLPVLLFPVLGVLKTEQVCSEYIKVLNKFCKEQKLYHEFMKLHQIQSHEFIHKAMDPSITVIGIFAIVAAIERWGLHRRIALGILLLFGTQSHWLVLGILVTTSVLSLFMTVGVAVLMLPIIRGIMDRLRNVERLTDMDTEAESEENCEDYDEDHAKTEKQQISDMSQYDDEVARLFKALSLAVTYGTTLGSTATMTGEPSNLIMVGLTEQFYRNFGVQSKVTFINWLIFTGPLTVIIVIFAWIWLVVYFLKGQGICRRPTVTVDMAKAQHRVKGYLKQEYEKLGPWSYAEIVVLADLLLLIVVFMTQDLYFAPGWGSWFKAGFVGRSAPAVLAPCLLFIIPAKSPRDLFSKRTEGDRQSRFAPILTWEAVSKCLPWWLLLLLGAAFVLVKATQVSGVSKEIAFYLNALVDLDPWVLTLAITALTTALTEIISNSATITMLLPIVGYMAILANMDPLSLIFPVTLAAKFSFTLPIATPPNAVVYTLGALKLHDMAIAGIVMNVLALISLNFASQTWGKAYFKWDIIPEEMRLNGSVSSNISSSVLS